MWKKSIKERIGNGESPEAIKSDIENLSAVRKDEKEVARLCKMVDQAVKDKG